MRDAQLAGVGKTALGVAFVRAEESKRPDRLFDDPFAAAFVAAVSDAFTDSRVPTTPVARNFVQGAIIRTRFFDDYLRTSGHRQVVLLAAGLDTRALRLGWPPGTRLFELDLPEVLAFKEEVLAQTTARCERVIVPADLRGDWAARLAESGFDRQEPTAWLAEGLFIYLSALETARLLTTVGELSAPGSQIAFEHGTAAETATVAEAGKSPGMAEYTAMWKGGLGSRTPEWLTRQGWHVELHDRTRVATSYGRPGKASGGLLIARREGT